MQRFSLLRAPEADSAEFGEGAVAGYPIVVVADRCHQRGGGVGADTVDGAQLRCGGDGVDVVFEGCSILTEQCLTRVSQFDQCGVWGDCDLIGVSA